MSDEDEGLTLTENQQEVLDTACDWNKESESKKLTIGGLAGTGKTTLIKEMLKRDQFSNWAVASFTGKAVDVLRSKGIGRAQTIHDLMYHVLSDKDNEIKFTRHDGLERNGVIVDEASMVDTTLFRDLTKFNIPIIWVGDMGQLEPIGDDPRLMSDPDLKLTQIHRQALKSPIVRLSMLIREGAEFSEWQAAADGMELNIRRQNTAVYSRMIEFAAKEGTMTICGFNATRMDINRGARRIRGYTEPVCEGDKVICLANEKQQGVFNGMSGVVNEAPKLLNGATYLVSIKLAGITNPRRLKCDFGPVFDDNFDKKAWMRAAVDRRASSEGNDLTLWDHGYGITCHKAQGSEADEVAVWDQQCDYWDSTRWRYTAVTRAKRRLIYCT